MDAVLDALRQLRAGRSVLDPGVVDALVRRRSNPSIDDLTASPPPSLTGTFPEPSLSEYGP